MKENVFIIGNGFDLDLGLRTSYSDFASSPFWPTKKYSIDLRNIEGRDIATSKLEYVINECARKEDWLDLEEDLLCYAKKHYDKKHPYYNLISKESQSDVVNNLVYYSKLRNSLCDYIKYMEKSQRIRIDSIACEVLKAVVRNGLFNNIISFNYTDLNAIAKRININQEIQYEHLHGKVSDNSIILGVDKTEMRLGYDIFHKTSQLNYPYNNLGYALTNANEIVFFGLSFGSIDYSYFERFFKGITESNPIPEYEKQHITIFTKNKDSSIAIKRRLSEHIDIQYLYTQAKFKVICTSNIKENKEDKNELDDFYSRLKDFSKEANANKQYDFLELLP